MSAYTKNMTEGSELRLILRFTLPLLVGNIFQQLYNIVDTVIVGKILGSDALAAVGATGSMTYFFYTLCIGLATGAGIMISQFFGANSENAVKKMIANSAYVLAAFGVLLSVISVFLAPVLLRLLDTPANVIGDATEYMKIACGGTVMVALQNAMISVSMIALQRTANGFGDTVMAAYTATMRIEQLVQQPFSSLNAALSAFTGQNVGAGKVERVIKGYRKSVKTAMIFAAAVTVIFLVLANYIVGFFVNETDVIDIGATALRLSCCFYFFLGLIHTTRGILNGAGDTDYAMINGFVEVAGRIGFSLILVHIPAVGHWAVWGTTCLTWLVTAVMSVIRYKGGRWRKHFIV